MSVITPLDIVMVYEELHTGGIETLILRSSNAFVQRGFPVWVFCKPGGDERLQELFDPRVTVINFNDGKELIDLFKNCSAIGHGGRTALVLSFDSSSAAWALGIEASHPRSLNIINLTGIFHPQWYFMRGQPLDRVLLNYMVATAFGQPAIFFMNEECRSSHAAKWKMRLKNSRVIPLPIDEIEPLWRRHDPDPARPLRVISVGRLVDFKAYNRGVAKIVRSCLDSSIELAWDIYGYGPEEPLVRARIEAFEVRDNVRLMGPLEYADFTRTVSEYDLFVGMGTAAAEAAMVGVPTICAAINEEEKTHGFLNEIPFGNLGEYVSGDELRDISDLIRFYSSLDGDGRSTLSRESIAAARKYRGSAFLDSILELAARQPASRRRIRKYVVSALFYSLTEGALARTLLRRGLKSKIFRTLRTLSDSVKTPT
jgi:glycosyltransferase involved in cell wall biosynthesis